MVIDANTRVRNEASLVEINRKPDAILQDGDNTFYLGYAFAGTKALDEPKWHIQRITIDPATGMTLFMYPNGNKSQYIFQFSECKNYNYSFAM